MDLQFSLVNALACEDRTRAAERRATDAEAAERRAKLAALAAEERASYAEARASNARREMRRAMFDSHICRGLILSVVPDIANGSAERSIRRVCEIADGLCSSDGEDAWLVKIKVVAPSCTETMLVAVYWQVSTLKIIFAERYDIPLLQQIVMHAGMQLDDSRVLGDYDLHDAAHHGGVLPEFFISAHP